MPTAQIDIRFSHSEKYQEKVYMWRLVGSKRNASWVHKVHLIMHTFLNQRPRKSPRSGFHKCFCLTRPQLHRGCFSRSNLESATSKTPQEAFSQLLINFRMYFYMHYSPLFDPLFSGIFLNTMPKVACRS